MRVASDSGAWQVPEPIGKLCAKLPRPPGSFLLVKALNIWLSPHLPQDIQAALEGRRLRVKVLDTHMVFDYTWSGQAFKPIYRPVAEPELILSAKLWDFYQLLQRAEDPDTLFFKRRLRIEGDTELGLMVKNTMDSIDTGELQASKLVQAVLTRIKAKVRGTAS